MEPAGNEERVEWLESSEWEGEGFDGRGSFIGLIANRHMFICSFVLPAYHHQNVSSMKAES